MGMTLFRCKLNGLNCQNSGNPQFPLIQIQPKVGVILGPATMDPLSLGIKRATV